MTDKPEQQTQTVIRYPDSLLERADKLAERMSEPGMRVTRTEVLRLATFRGIAEIEAERKKR
jgi:hypothetical protein